MPDGSKRYRVRFRNGKQETSETFRLKRDADDFSAILAGGGVSAAMNWLKARETVVHNVTFGEWFEQYVDQLTGITSRTRDDYRAMRRRYLTGLDHLQVELVTRAHVTSLVNRLDAEGKSPKTIKNVINMLSTCMALAVDEQIITRNPCSRVRLPKDSTSEQTIRFLTREEAARLMAYAPEEYEPFIAFLFGTGLRWSEATAIQCRHVDLDRGTVRVERAWKRVKGGQEIGPPKTPKARRTVNAAVPALVAAAHAMSKPDALLFQSSRGGPVHHGNFYNRVWVPACEAAGLTDPRPRVHDSRHTFASWLLSDGISLEAVQDQLGHESSETTRKVYAHLLPAVGVDVGRKASAAMSEVLSHAQDIRARRVVGVIEP